MPCLKALPGLTMMLRVRNIKRSYFYIQNQNDSKPKLNCQLTEVGEQIIILIHIYLRLGVQPLFIGFKILKLNVFK